VQQVGEVDSECDVISGAARNEHHTTHVLWLLLLFFLLLGGLVAALLGLLLLFLFLGVSTSISTDIDCISSAVPLYADARHRCEQGHCLGPMWSTAGASDSGQTTHVGTKKEAREEKNPPADPLCSPVNEISVDMLWVGT
jgi:hypothetical protein